MGAMLFVQTLGATPFFAMRPVLAIFCISLLGRLVPQETGVTEPTWLFADLTFGLLALFAVVELAAYFDESSRVAVDEAYRYIKPGAQFVASFPILDAQTGALLGFLAAQLPPGLLESSSALTAWGGGSILLSAIGWLGHILALVGAVIGSALTWYFSTLRAAVNNLLTLGDEDDSLGIGGILHWVETIWTAGGIALLLIFPPLALGILALTFLGIFVTYKAFEFREKRSLLSCQYCATPMFPQAPHCPQCRQPAPHIRRVGLFGQARADLVTDRLTHQLELLSRKRCACCAARLKGRTLQERCPACGGVTFADPQSVQIYLNWLAKRLPQTLLISGAFSLVPFFGIAPAVIYARLNLISGLRSYVPRSVGCLTTWAMRIVMLILIAFQWVPLLGALSVPIVCFLQYSIYRRVILGNTARMVPGALVPVATPPAPIDTALLPPGVQIVPARTLD